MTQFKFTGIVRQFVATIAVVGLVASTPPGGVRSVEASQSDHENTQMAEIHVLLTSVHTLTSYNGDPGNSAQHLATWAQLWAEDATLLVNGTTIYEGRDTIMGSFFSGSALFTRNLVGLTPSFRTEIDISGNTAEIYLECIFLNESETIFAKRALSGTIKKVDGRWMFWRMNNNPALPLF